MSDVNSLLQIEEIEVLLRQLHKIDSKMLSGQFIIAFREINSIIAYLERAKKSVVEKVKKDMEDKQ